MKTTGADTTSSTFDMDGPPPSSPRSTCSDASASSSESNPSVSYAVSLASSDQASDIDESELGEFLLDALEGYDPMLTSMDHDGLDMSNM